MRTKIAKSTKHKALLFRRFMRIKMLSFLFAYVYFVFFILFFSLRRVFACLRLLLFLFAYLLFMLAKSFLKWYKTSSIPSFTILLHHYNTFSRYHYIFLSPQYFTIITICFYHHNIFLSAYFSIITIFFITIFFNLFAACNTIKISQCENSIIYHMSFIIKT